MEAPEAKELQAAWSLAAAAFPKGAAERLLKALAPDVSALLVDGSGSQADAARLLELHGAEAWVAERLVLKLGGAALVRSLTAGSADAAGSLVAAIPKAERRRTRQLIDRALAPLLRAKTAIHAESLFPRSFSTRAQKRRGGVYTNTALVDLVLDLVGWRGQGPLLEPAAGAGAFLLRAWERGLDAGVPASRLAKRLVGNDVHPFACRAARTGLALAAASRGTGPKHVPFVSHADALLGPPDAPTEAKGAYAFVVGNPPWVRGERIPAQLREAYRQRAGALGKGNVDLASFFVKRAFDWLAPGGKLAFVVTQGLLEARSSAGLRGFLAEHTLEALVTLEWAPPQFAEATVIPCLLVVSKRPPPPKHRIPLGIWQGEKVRWTRVLQSSWLDLTRGTTRPWPLLLERGDLGFLKRLRRQPTPLRAGYGLAVRTRTGARSLISEGPAPASFSSPQPLLDGREVRAWAINYRGRNIDYRPELISDPKTPAFFAGPKVVVPRIALTPQAAVDDGPRPFYARNTVMILRAPETALEGAPHAVAALINSLPVRAYAFLLLRAGVLASSHRSTLYSGMLNELPVPQRVLDEPRLLKRLTTLGKRARDLAAVANHKALRTLEAKIDEAVALAFGLTPAQLGTLRARANRDPFRAILNPARAGDPTRRIAVAEYTAGSRYR